MEQDFTIPEHKERRRAFRAPIPECRVLVHGKDRKYPFPAKDVSVLGLSFAAKSKALAPGLTLKIDLVRNEETLVANLRAKIVWAAEGVVGCEFAKLEETQEDRLHAIVLAEQKRLAERRKAKAAPAAETGPGPEAEPDQAKAHKPIPFVDPWSSQKKR